MQKQLFLPAFPLLQDSELCQPGDIQHSVHTVPVQLCLPVGPWTPQLHRHAANYRCSAHGMGQSGLGVHTIRSVSPEHAVKIKEIRPWQEGVFSKWSCQVLEKRNQSQTSLSSTGEDNLSRHDWQDTRFGETPLLWHRHCHTLTPPSPQRGFTETSAHLVLFPIDENLHTNKQSALK